MTRGSKPYLSRKVIRGRRRVFFRKTWLENGKRRERYVEIQHPEDSPEFDREYWKLRSGQSERLKPGRATHTYGELIRSYRRSSAYLTRAPATRKKYDDVLEALLEKNATKDVRKTTRSQVRAIHEKYAATPRKADWQIQVIKLLFNFAIQELDWPMTNPAAGISLFGTSKEHEPWPEWLQKAYDNAAQARDDVHGQRALIARHLGCGTGQRPSDLVSMEWDHFDGEYMAVVQDKTKTRLWVYCPTFLRNFLESVPRTGRFILAKNLTEPLTYWQMASAFQKVRGALGHKAESYVMHGWRFTAATELAEAGCSDAEIQSVTGHKSLAMVQKYRGRAQQKLLSRTAQQRRQRG
ncbi:site-specific integrase [Histidinibacterium aquaticum]|uniref:site-specific integrase n=1 Tax=Histidinibacterium aquaticum TaxID=2613962 RepID=UPI00168B79A7|nr:site-specific integrase [Histidinibacterium aquaticum]